MRPWAADIVVAVRDRGEAGRHNTDVEQNRSGYRQQGKGDDHGV
jgi:hypothetical protein